MMRNSIITLDFLIVMEIMGSSRNSGQVITLSLKRVGAIISCYICGFMWDLGVVSCDQLTEEKKGHIVLFCLFFVPLGASQYVSASQKIRLLLHYRSSHEWP